LRLLERIVGQQRKDLEFLQGKCERLELAIMSQAQAPAQHEYVARTDQRPNVVGALEKLTTGTRLPWREVQRKWANMSEADQVKAVEAGQLKINLEEDANAGS
jgi:hypothetical protein